ncbi:MAG TPA: metal-dependent hydrolase [Gammaproteobacteria bacterium]|nr:metal-dependent hydrolase [Gammaproteobacteria bacterium]|tara:strand:- start:8000 stop:8992 length:993 start_codon:yes stop_codon:yes gene_type:complete
MSEGHTKSSDNGKQGERRVQEQALVDERGDADQPRTSTYRYKPKSVDTIVIRNFSFEFPPDTDPLWIPNQRVRSHFFNGVSLTMPYLEPFLVKTEREAANYIDSQELQADIRGFCGQEAQHYKCHQRLNAVLRENGYSEFAELEERMARSWQRLLRRDLETRLAYAAGFESMTNGFTRWMIKKRLQLFRGADPHITSFWLTHMVEETEHKTVALDVYMAYSGRFLPRFLGVLHGSFHVIGWGVIGMVAALRKDGVLTQPRTLVELLREAVSLVYEVGPFMLRALLPGHDPRREQDPQWMRDWIEGYAKLPEGQKIPLVDTQHPAMPVPYQ